MAERETVVPLTSIGTQARGRPEPRQMPHNADAEQGLLGALLIDNRAYEKVADLLKVEHFYAPAHGRIYGLIAKLIERGQIASPVTVLKGACLRFTTMPALAASDLYCCMIWSRAAVPEA